MNLLLTGYSGFVGKNLIPCLQAQKITVLPQSLRGDWQVSLPKQYDAIIHLAGKAHATSSTKNAEEYFQVNTELTKQLFDIFLHSAASDFIYFSSVKAIADTVEGVLMEDAVPNPQTAYGKSKLLAEQHLLSKELPSGKRLFIIRPCMIHGPGNKGNLNLLYKIVKKRFPWPLASFENHRSFLSIDNLIFLITEILKNKTIASGVYHVADDETLSTNELIQLIATTTGKKPKLWYINKRFIERLTAIGDKCRLPLNSERLKKLTENYIVSNQKIKDALQIDRLPITAQKGIIATIKSFNQ